MFDLGLREMWEIYGLRECEKNTFLQNELSSYLSKLDFSCQCQSTCRSRKIAQSSFLSSINPTINTLFIKFEINNKVFAVFSFLFFVFFSGFYSLFFSPHQWLKKKHSIHHTSMFGFFTIRLRLIRFHLPSRCFIWKSKHSDIFLSAEGRSFCSYLLGLRNIWCFFFPLFSH